MNPQDKAALIFFAILCATIVALVLIALLGAVML